MVVLLLLGLGAAAEAGVFLQSAVQCGRLGKVTAELPRCCRPTGAPNLVNWDYGCCEQLEWHSAPPLESEPQVLRIAAASLATRHAVHEGPAPLPARGERRWSDSYARPPPQPIPTSNIVLLL